MAVDAPHPAFEEYANEAVPQAAPGAPGKDGELELAFAADADGRTRLVRDYARVPYHVSGTLDHDPHPDAATVYVQSPTGGVAQGDRLRAAVRAGPDAVAVVSTGSAAKVQSMDRNYASETLSLSVDPTGHLAYVPEPTILHADARFYQETTLSVGEGATAVVGDVVLPGRLARDERFDFERYYARVRAEGPDGLLFEDATHLRPGESDPAVAGVFDEFSVYGTLYVVAPDADASSLADRLHERAAAGEARAAATTLPNAAGAVVRALAARGEQVTETLHAAWDAARRTLLGAGAPDTRRY